MKSNDTSTYINDVADEEVLGSCHVLVVEKYKLCRGEGLGFRVRV